MLSSKASFRLVACRIGAIYRQDLGSLHAYPVGEGQMDISIGLVGSLKLRAFHMSNFSVNKTLRGWFRKSHPVRTGQRGGVVTNTQYKLSEIIRSLPWVRASIWEVRRRFHAIERRVLVGRPVVDGSAIINDAITRGIPFAAGKMGSIEAASLLQYLRRSSTPRRHQAAAAYSPYIFQSLHVNAGVFPKDSANYDRFCELYLEAVKSCEALALWDVAGEARIIGAHCPAATLIRLRDLEPYFLQQPWSHALEGKKVLVISPFAASIERQYARREAVWGARSILPPFTLMTIRAPLSAALVPPKHKDWFEALDYMKACMDGLDYDVALIGAGAYSLPLAAYAKKRNKVGLHLGGSLQMLFGIVGKRWRANKDFAPLINSAWSPPTAEETPENCGAVEGGCYW